MARSSRVVALLSFVILALFFLSRGAEAKGPKITHKVPKSTANLGADDAVTPDAYVLYRSTSIFNMETSQWER